MPSHPDRVRRNYHDVKATVTESPASCEHTLHIRITKSSIASWSSARAIRDMFMRKIYKEFETVLPR